MTNTMSSTVKGQAGEPEVEIHVLTEDERRLLQEGLDELDRSEVATAAEVRAVFDKYRDRKFATRRRVRSQARL